MKIFWIACQNHMIAGKKLFNNWLDNLKGSENMSNLDLSKKIAKLESDNKILQSESVILNEKLEESENQRRILEKQLFEINQNNLLKFDELTGTWFNEKQSVRYCANCKVKIEKLSPLISHNHGWKCPVCDKNFRDPSQPLPPIISGNRYKNNMQF